MAESVDTIALRTLEERITEKLKESGMEVQPRYKTGNPDIDFRARSHIYAESTAGRFIVVPILNHASYGVPNFTKKRGAVRKSGMGFVTIFDKQRNAEFIRRGLLELNKIHMSASFRGKENPGVINFYDGNQDQIEVVEVRYSSSENQGIQGYRKRYGARLLGAWDDFTLARGKYDDIVEFQEPIPETVGEIVPRVVTQVTPSQHYSQPQQQSFFFAR